MAQHRPPARRAKRRRGARFGMVALITGVLISLAVGTWWAWSTFNLSGRDSGGPGAEPSDSVVTTTAELGTLTGSVPATGSEAAIGEVAEVVDGWFDAAFLGDYPRSDFSAAFGNFDRSARKLALVDIALLTNQTSGPQLQEVVALERALLVDVMGTKNGVIGATAHVDFVIENTPLDSSLPAVNERILGELFLIKRQGAWSIFGYDVLRSAQ